MENPRPEKVAVVDEVRAKLDSSDAAVLTEYRGLNVSATAELRRALRDAGGEFKVYKNTLVRIAARELGLEIDALLTGPTAIAFIDGDPVNVAKALRDFAKTNPALVIKGGLLGDSVIDEKGVTALADLEPREVLLAKLAGALAAPMQQFAGLLEALPRNFAYGLKALIDQGGAPGAPADAPAPAAADETPDAEAPAAVDETPDAEAAAPTDEPAAEATEAPAADTDTDTPAAESADTTESES
ncbi:MAG: ribosomal protein [Acidimicrobiales bacterium]|nr:ribosomal protein [Acidimicrobiales bacterium]